jgi:hypothetical protein
MMIQTTNSKMKFIFLILMSTTITSCNSFYNNQYVYLPPSQPEARECILACRNAKQECDDSANKAYQECLRQAERSSMLNYTINLNNQQTSVTTKDRHNIEQCRFYSKACEQSYNDCYVNCGGKVEANDYSTVR